MDSIARAVANGTLADTAHTPVIQADGWASYYAWSGDRVAALRWLPVALDQSFRSLRSDPVAAAQLRAIVGHIWDRVERLGPR